MAWMMYLMNFVIFIEWIIEETFFTVHVATKGQAGQKESRKGLLMQYDK